MKIKDNFFIIVRSMFGEIINSEKHRIDTLDAVLTKLKDSPKKSVDNADSLSMKMRMASAKNLSGMLVLTGSSNIGNSSIASIAPFLIKFQVTTLLNEIGNYLSGKEDTIDKLSRDVNGLDFVFRDNVKYFGDNNPIKQIQDKAKAGFIGRKVFKISNKPVIAQQVIGFSQDSITALMIYSKGGKPYGEIVTCKVLPSLIKTMAEKTTTVNKKTLIRFGKAVIDSVDSKEIFNRVRDLESAITDANTKEDGSQFLDERKHFVKHISKKVVKASLATVKSEILLVQSASLYLNQQAKLYGTDTRTIGNEEDVEYLKELNRMLHEQEEEEVVGNEVDIELFDLMGLVSVVGNENEEIHALLTEFDQAIDAVVAYETDIEVMRMTPVTDEYETTKHYIESHNRLVAGLETCDSLNEFLADSAPQLKHMPVDSILKVDGLAESDGVLTKLWNWIRRVWRAITGKSEDVAGEVEKDIISLKKKNSKLAVNIVQELDNHSGKPIKLNGDAKKHLTNLLMVPALVTSHELIDKTTLLDILEVDIPTSIPDYELVEYIETGDTKGLEALNLDKGLHKIATKRQKWFVRPPKIKNHETYLCSSIFTYGNSFLNIFEVHSIKGKLDIQINKYRLNFDLKVEGKLRFDAEMIEMLDYLVNSSEIFSTKEDGFFIDELTEIINGKKNSSKKAKRTKEVIKNVAALKVIRKRAHRSFINAYGEFLTALSEGEQDG